MSKIVHKYEAHVFKEGKVFMAYEYAGEMSDINMAHVKIHGRYPLQGVMRNTKVSEVVYVENGSGEVSINGIDTKINKGDVVYYESGDRVFWNGELSLVITCAPAWTKEQHEFLPQ